MATMISDMRDFMDVRADCGGRSLLRDACTPAHATEHEGPGARDE